MITGVILAAGEAERMGELKQLLKWKENNTIIGRSIDNLMAAKIVDDQLLIITGAESQRIADYLQLNYSDEINSDKIRIINNPDYENGMLTSVKTALKNVCSDSSYILFTLADKPFITAEIYQSLYKAFLQKRPEVFLPLYKKQKGHPVILKRTMIKKALKLNGRGGLRNLFRLVPHRIYHYHCQYPQIITDIDYQFEYKRYKNSGFELRKE